MQGDQYKPVEFWNVSFLGGGHVSFAKRKADLWLDARFSAQASKGAGAVGMAFPKRGLLPTPSLSPLSHNKMVADKSGHGSQRRRPTSLGRHRCPLTDGTFLWIWKGWKRGLQGRLGPELMALVSAWL